MLAEVPRVFVEAGTWAGIFTTLSVATAILWKTPPMRWFRNQVSSSLGNWLKNRVTEAAELLIAPLQEDLTDIKKVVNHHLGHNGESPKLHDRVQQMEAALRGQVTSQENDNQD